ncbi:MAG: hypothetical protein AB3N63_06305 [Puniceicoccaceae bacterium]
MTDTRRAVLLSMLLCPGGGHLYLRRWWRGSLFVVPFVLAVGYYIFYTVDNTIDVINMVVAEEIEADQKVIEEVLRDRLWRNPSVYLHIDRAVILVVWLLAAIDVFFVSRRLSAQSVNTEQPSDS